MLITITTLMKTSYSVNSCKIANTILQHFMKKKAFIKILLTGKRYFLELFQKICYIYAAQNTDYNYLQASLLHVSEKKC